MKGLVLFLFILCQFSFAQDSLYQKFKIIPEKAFSGAGKDFTGLFTKPFEDKKRSLITIGAFAATTLVVYQFDDEIQAWSQRNKSEFFDEFSEEVAEPLGGGDYSMMLVGGIAATGLLFKNERWLETGYLGAEAFIYAGLLSRFPKILFGRQRPYVGSIPEKHRFEGPSLGVDGDDWFDQWKSNRNASYISGHTTTAFAIATVFAEQSIKHNKNKWVPYVSYGLATVCAYSRIYDNKHWATDLIGGALFGHLVGRYLVRNHHWQVKPYRFQSTEGITLSRTF